MEAGPLVDLNQGPLIEEDVNKYQYAVSSPGARQVAGMGLTQKHPLTALRTTTPVVDKVTPTTPPKVLPTAPRRGRKVALAAVIVFVLGLA